MSLFFCFKLSTGSIQKRGVFQLLDKGPTCKVNVDKISAVKTSSIDVVPKTGWVEVKNPDVWTERWPHYDGGVWYHFNWHWSCNDSNELKQPLAFSVEGMSSAGAVFSNSANFVLTKRSR